MSDKRDWLFSGLDGSVRHSVQLDDVAEYSVTDSVTADTLSALLLAFVGAEATVTDACACVGGNTLSFARHFAHVQVDTSPHAGTAARTPTHRGSRWLNH